jgi:hypothetical protein
MTPYAPLSSFLSHLNVDNLASSSLSMYEGRFCDYWGRNLAFLKKSSKSLKLIKVDHPIVIETKNKPKMSINRNLDTFFYLDDIMYPIMWMEEKM